MSCQRNFAIKRISILRLSCLQDSKNLGEAAQCHHHIKIIMVSVVMHSFGTLLPYSPYITVCGIDKWSRKTVEFGLLFCTAELNTKSK